jgi:hypothetical protein
MTVRRPALPATGAIACAAVALWVSLGALTFTDASTHTSRVGLLPPLSLLAALLGLALVAALVFRPAHRRVGVLWLSAIVLVPWLPLRLPLAVFMWAGPLHLWLWAAIATTLAVPFVRDHASPRVVRALATPSTAAPLAAALAALLFGAGAWAVAPRLPTGDEPHYLVMAQSLLQDHDIQIENNHKQGDYRAYFDGTLRPDYLRRGLNGAIYSIHAPGLPALVAPVFAVFGYPGVKAALILLSACATGLVWLLAWRCTGQPGASWFGWATVTCSTPFFFHAFSVYPDTPGAAISALGVWPLVDERARRPGRLFGVGVAIATLPWLHTRFAILAATLTLVIAARVVTQPDAITRLAALCVVPLASAAAWFLFFWTIYGTPNPAAPYGGTTQTGLAFLPAGLAGLLFDQQFGLIPNAPIFLCAVLGFVAMARHGHRRLAAELLIVAVPYVLVVAAVPMWWAGYSAPSRFLVSLTLLLGLPAAIWFSTRKTDAARIAGIALLVVSALITISIASVDRGALLFNTRTGFSLLLLRIAPVVDLTRGLPSSFQTPPPMVAFHAAIWLLAIACPPAIAVLLDRRGRGRGALVLVIGLGWAIATMSATAFVWRSNRATSIARETGGIELLRHYDPTRQQLALSYEPFRRLAAAELPARITLAQTAPGAGRPQEPLLFVMHPIAGVYEVEGVTTTGGSGHVRVRLDRQLPGIDDWDLSSSIGPWRRTIRLPVAADILRLDADADARRSVLRLSIRAVDLPGPAAGYASDAVAIHGTRYGPAVVYHTGGHAYMEPTGTWVGGGDFADFVIAPDTASRARLFVRNGAASNRVGIEAGSWREELALNAGEERLLDIPAEAGQIVAVRVSSATGARPADSDPHNADRRLLGCWIETR